MKEQDIINGRVQQKLKTRTSILEAAERLINRQSKISLEEVAKEANISRATIYRYFSNIEFLIMEVSLNVHHDSPQELYERTKEYALVDKILYVQKHYNQHAKNHESLFRRYLSAVLAEAPSPAKKLRGGRRVSALIKLLEPHKNQIKTEHYEKLIYISSLLIGIDAITVCKDVCGLNNTQTDEVLEWGLKTILKGIDMDEQDRT